MQRFHQLTGPNNKIVTWTPGTSIQYYFTDLPMKTQICGKKYVSAVKGVKLTFNLQVNNPGPNPVVLSRDDVNNILISQIQVDGSLLGTLVSAAYTKPGMLDITDYIANGGHMEAQVYDPIVVPVNVAPGPGVTPVFGIPIRHEVFIPFGYYGCPSPMSMAPMASFIRPANLKIDAPQATVLTNYGLAFGLNGQDSTSTCIGSAYIEWRDEITIAPGFQMTRYKSTATTSATGASVADTVDLKSFGSNGTLTGVEQRAAIAALLWASSAVSGDGTGAGPAESLSDISALFAGIEQTNDLQPFLDELNSEFTREAPFMRNPIYSGGATAPSQDNRRYPFFTSDKPTTVARVFPIFPPRKKCHISKMPIADSSPSYQITGQFGPSNGGGSDHYSYMYGLYKWADQQTNALIEALARDDIGRWLYPSAPDANQLVAVLKTHKKNVTSPNFSKITFLPSKMLPASIAASIEAERKA
jgi:hypothetical protein